jgi:uncharacterized membrane protein HdeD (DUF308 family)
LEAIMSTTAANTDKPQRDIPWERLGEVLAKDWWLLALRGLLGVIFGVIAILMPGPTLLALLLLFCAYMLVDGVFALYTAIRAMLRRDTWGMPLLQGIASIATGVIAFLWPGITVLTFVLLVGAWSIVSGSLMIAAAYNVEGPYGRGWMAFSGITSLLFGFLLILSPIIGAVVLTWWIGTYAMIFGITMVVLAFRLRKQHKQKPSARSTNTTSSGDPSVGSARPAT